MSKGISIHPSVNKGSRKAKQDVVKVSANKNRLKAVDEGAVGKLAA